MDTPLHVIQQGEGDDLTLVMKSPDEWSQNPHIYGSRGPKDKVQWCDVIAMDKGKSISSQDV